MQERIGQGLIISDLANNYTLLGLLPGWFGVLVFIWGLGLVFFIFKLAHQKVSTTQSSDISSKKSIRPNVMIIRKKKVSGSSSARTNTAVKYRHS